jgi:hypothetical protein
MNGKLIADLMVNSGIAQYPDASVYNAAKLLTPDERPVVPVKVADNPKKKQEAGYDTVAKQINVNSSGKSYQEFGKKPHRLAAALAHEAVHSKQEAPYEEEPAYTKQYEVLKRLKEKDGDMLRALSYRTAYNPYK